MTEVQNIFKKDANGLWQSMRNQKVKDSNNTWRTFGVGSGVKGNEGEWYVLNSLIPDFVVYVAGIYWYKNNITSNYLNFDQAQSIALASGGKCPTLEEFTALNNVYYKWDNVSKGMWYADFESDLGDPNKSVFFPALGLSGGGSGLWGYYWSSSQTGKLGYFLNFYDGYSSPDNAGGKMNAFSVRLVREIFKN